MSENAAAVDAGMSENAAAVDAATSDEVRDMPPEAAIAVADSAMLRVFRSAGNGAEPARIYWRQGGSYCHLAFLARLFGLALYRAAPVVPAAPLCPAGVRAMRAQNRRLWLGS